MKQFLLTFFAEYMFEDEATLSSCFALFDEEDST